MVSGLGAETPPRPAHRPTTGLSSPLRTSTARSVSAWKEKPPLLLRWSGEKGGREGMRNRPSARRSPGRGHVFPPVPTVGEAVTQATLRGRHEHLRCPVSRRRVHPTSPVSCCPGLDDSQCLLSLRNAAIPTVPNTTRSAGPSVLAPLFVPVTPHTNTNASVMKRPRRDTGHYYDI